MQLLLVMYVAVQNESDSMNWYLCGSYHYHLMAVSTAVARVHIRVLYYYSVSLAASGRSREDVPTQTSNSPLTAFHPWLHPLIPHDGIQQLNVERLAIKCRTKPVCREGSVHFFVPSVSWQMLVLHRDHDENSARRKPPIFLFCFFLGGGGRTLSHPR